MSLIKDIHHVALTCVTEEEYRKTLEFYHEILGLDVKRTWDGGMMLAAGDRLIEVFLKEEETRLEQGTIRHFAFAADDVDACLKAVSDAGYEILVPATDIVIPAETAYPARIGFCRGPVGEEIEFFCEK